MSFLEHVRMTKLMHEKSAKGNNTYFPLEEEESKSDGLESLKDGDSGKKSDEESDKGLSSEEDEAQSSGEDVSPNMIRSTV